MHVAMHWSPNTKKKEAENREKMRGRRRGGERGKLAKQKEREVWMRSRM